MTNSTIDNLTDLQLAESLNQLNKAFQKCGNDLQALIDKASEITEKVKNINQVSEALNLVNGAEEMQSLLTQISELQNFIPNFETQRQRVLVELEEQTTLLSENRNLQQEVVSQLETIQLERDRLHSISIIIDQIGGVEQWQQWSIQLVEIFELVSSFETVRTTFQTQLQVINEFQIGLQSISQQQDNLFQAIARLEHNLTNNLTKQNKITINLDHLDHLFHEHLEKGHQLQQQLEQSQTQIQNSESQISRFQEQTAQLQEHYSQFDKQSETLQQSFAEIHRQRNEFQIGLQSISQQQDNLLQATEILEQRLTSLDSSKMLVSLENKINTLDHKLNQQIEEFSQIKQRIYRIEREQKQHKNGLFVISGVVFIALLAKFVF